MPPAGQDLFEKRSRHPQKLLIRVFINLIRSFGKSRNLFSKRFLVAEGIKLLTIRSKTSKINPVLSNKV